MREITKCLMVVIITAITIIGLYLWTTQTQEPQGEAYSNISAENVFMTIEDWDCKWCLHIIDVRTPEEYAEGYIISNNLNVSNATNINLYDDFSQNILAYDSLNNVFGLGKDTYLIYCKRGVRSIDASLIMIDLGFENVYNVEGGYLAWKELGYPTSE